MRRRRSGAPNSKMPASSRKKSRQSAADGQLEETLSLLGRGPTTGTLIRLAKSTQVEAPALGALLESHGCQGDGDLRLPAPVGDLRLGIPDAVPRLGETIAAVRQECIPLAARRSDLEPVAKALVIVGVEPEFDAVIGIQLGITLEDPCAHVLPFVGAFESQVDRAGVVADPDSRSTAGLAAFDWIDLGQGREVRDLRPLLLRELAIDTNAPCLIDPTE